MEKKREKVLITGANGFIGANLTRRLLTKNFEIHAVSRKDSQIWRLEEIAEKINIHRGDLADKDFVHKLISSVKPQYIFHLAQYGGYPLQKELNRIIEINLMSTINLLIEAEKTGFKKFVYSGSSSEYGIKKKPMSEKNLIEPNTYYGIFKAASSLFCRHKGHDAKLPVSVLRLFSVYGPWEEPGRLMPTLAKKFINGENVQLVRKDVARDFVFVEDVVDVMILAMKSKRANDQIINIGTGKQTSLKDLVEKAESAWKGKIKAEWGNIEGRPFDSSKWVANVSLAKKTLGWKSKTDLETGLKKTLAWFKKNKKYYEN